MNETEKKTGSGENGMGLSEISIACFGDTHFYKRKKRITRSTFLV